MNKITVEWLEKQGACSDGLNSFRSKFNKETDPKQCLKWLQRIEGNDWLAWLLAQDLELTKILLKQGADVHVYYDCALRWAAEAGHLEVVKYLIEWGADIHAGNDYALCLAAERGHLEVVKYLIEQGTDVHADDDCALHWAAREGHLEVVELLKQHS